MVSLLGGCGAPLELLLSRLDVHQVPAEGPLREALPGRVYVRVVTHEVRLRRGRRLRVLLLLHHVLATSSSVVLTV